MQTQIEDDWLQTAKKIQMQLEKLDRRLSDKLSPITAPEPLEFIDDLESDTTISEEEELQPGIYVAISDWIAQYDEKFHQISVQLGQVVKVTVVFEGWAFGENQTTMETGHLPTSVLVKLSTEFVLELANDVKEKPSSQVHLRSTSHDTLITLNELSDTKKKDSETHCLESEVGMGSSIYFAWKYGGSQVYVWGSFNNWSRPIQLFYDGNNDIHVAFAECEDIDHGELCVFKFFVDNEWRVDPNFTQFEDDEDGSKYNSIVVCTKFVQGYFFSVAYQTVRYIIPARRIKAETTEEEISMNTFYFAVHDARIQDAIEYLESCVVLQNAQMAKRVLSMSGTIVAPPKDHRFDSGISINENRFSRIAVPKTRPSSFNQNGTVQNISTVIVESNMQSQITLIEPVTPSNVMMESPTPTFEFKLDLESLLPKPKQIIKPPQTRIRRKRKSKTYHPSPLSSEYKKERSTVIFSENLNLAYQPILALFSQRVDLIITMGMLLALVSHLNLLVQVLSTSWQVVRLFYYIWAFCGLVFIAGKIIL
ncbi:Beta subunit 1 of SnRK1 [Boothiomyces macroporosus]|uniref:Beta subunit 1 of SnRK1 n=1 Tax=Boothiomyces macroporosus TaxID=261099 RepID=A0AAD5U9F5_9FUNG|nr:Beta subunit 1 of SnRK1 [Boothiomyces macroporosus]